MENNENMIFAALSIATGLFIILTLLPLSNYQAWWIRGLDFPRLQIGALLFGLLLLELILMDLRGAGAWTVVALTTACLIYQLWWIVPYTRLCPPEVRISPNTDPAATIRIMTANVLGTNRHSAEFLDIVYKNDPDILVTLESNLWWQQQLSVLEKTYTRTIQCPLENLYGMHVYSRIGLEHSEIRFLVEPDVPSMHTTAVLANQRKIRMIFLHPRPPNPTTQRSTERDAELLIVAENLGDDDIATIVAGDLNDVAWSKTTRLFRKISGLLDPRVGRGLFTTFHAEYRLIRWPLDHLFHSRHFLLSKIRRLPAFGSDHFPMLIELVYDEHYGQQQKGLEPAPGDHAEAAEKIRKVPRQDRMP